MGALKMANFSNANSIEVVPIEQHHQPSMGAGSSSNRQTLNFSGYSSNEVSPFASALDGTSSGHGTPQGLGVNMRRSVVQVCAEIVKGALATLERNRTLSQETVEGFRELIQRFESAASRESLAGNPGQELAEAQKEILEKLPHTRNEMLSRGAPSALADHAFSVLKENIDRLFTWGYRHIISIRGSDLT